MIFFIDFFLVYRLAKTMSVARSRWYRWRTCQIKPCKRFYEWLNCKYLFKPGEGRREFSIIKNKFWNTCTFQLQIGTARINKNNQRILEKKYKYILIITSKRGRKTRHSERKINKNKMSKHKFLALDWQVITVFYTSLLNEHINLKRELVKSF